MEQVASGFKETNQVFLWVVDLNDPIIKCWFGDEVLQEIRDRVLPLPKIHPSVIMSISGFVRVSQAYHVICTQCKSLPSCRSVPPPLSSEIVQKVPTIDRISPTIKRNTLMHLGSTKPCFTCASFHLFFPYPPFAKAYMYFAGCRVTLIDDSGDLLLSDELLEGTLECVLWATLVDLLLLNVPLAVRRYILFGSFFVLCLGVILLKSCLA